MTRSVFLTLITALFALATTGLPVAVSCCCNIPVAAQERCCDRDTDCCETEVVVTKVQDQSLVPEHDSMAAPCAEIIAVVPVEPCVAVQRASVQWYRSYLLDHPPHHPDQPSLAVFLM